VNVFRGSAGLAVLGFVLAACSNQEVVLPGQRLDIRAPFGGGAVQTQNKARPIRLERQVVNNSWPQRAGSASHQIKHPAFGVAPQQVWSTPIGQGNDKRHRIAADPVAANGRVFTLDSRATVAATTVTGAPLWSRDLTPSTDSADEASGGGLAVVGETVYVTTGFGDLVALNVADGSIEWRQRLESPAEGAPTVSNSAVYVATRDSRGIAIDRHSGRLLWQVQGVPPVAGVVGGAAPAIMGRLVIFPFGSTELVAAFRKGGLRVWTGSVAGARLGEAYAQVTDVTGDPVIRGNTVYAANSTGRVVALDLTTGETIWSAPEGATGPVWVDGVAVFLVSDRAQLVRLSARNGERVWATDLPKFVPERRQKRLRDVYAHFGPVLAGGRLWVASGDGRLRGFDPVDGAMSNSIELPSGAAARPIVVEKTMFVVTQDGMLRAFR